MLGADSIPPPGVRPACRTTTNRRAEPRLHGSRANSLGNIGSGFFVASSVRRESNVPQPEKCALETVLGLEADDTVPSRVYCRDPDGNRLCFVDDTTLFLGHGADSA